jgi:hypothetical protein
MSKQQNTLNIKQDNTYNVTLRWVSATTVAEEKQ